MDGGWTARITLPLSGPVPEGSSKYTIEAWATNGGGTARFAAAIAEMPLTAEDAFVPAEEENMERIFTEQMSELYWLAYLLTGDRERSVQAFTGALNSDERPPAFQRFLRAWAKKLVIVSALGTIRRQLAESLARSRPASRSEITGLARVGSVDPARLNKRELEEVLLAMDVFQRCAVILTVLEGLPVKEVAGLLGATEENVKAAQARGVTELAWRMADVIPPVARRPFGAGPGVMVAFG